MDILESVRPERLEDFVGQEHLFGESGVLKKYLESGSFPNSILYGPPGCGKTSVFYVMKRYLDMELHRVDAPSVRMSTIKKLVSRAKELRNYGKKLLLFVEDIDHINRKDQRIFLEPVERGNMVLVGTTTRNPYRYIIEPLISRLRIFKFKKLEIDEVKEILKRAVNRLNLRVDKERIETIALISDGDARFALLTLAELHEGGEAVEKEVFSRKEHYDLISAFIKSVRGSDPDAAVYYLARLLELGEDPRFIARRLVILASEDIGLADSRALVLAVAAAQAVDLVGLPEAEINLAHATLYLTLAPKSNSSYIAIKKAKEVASRPVEVPRHLKNLPDSGYLYPHDFGGYVEQRYLPEGIEGGFYSGKEIGEEKELLKRFRGRIRFDHYETEGKE